MRATTTATIPAALHAGPIRWQGWSDEAFRQAAADDKLVLVDVGAVWCHWCHVMDRTTYDHPEVARVVAEKFVAVRVDRDQRPDIDARLQRAAPLIRSGGNGWPLTVVLTPAGHVLYKATYLPPVADESAGVATGLVELLTELDSIYRQRRTELAAAGPEVADRLAQTIRAAVNQPGEVNDEAIGRVVAGIGRAFDPSFGGFGGEGEPKFPHPAAVDLCLLLAERNDDSYLRRVALDTLEAMARGGIHDHLAGGFHRYSVDRHWRVPHFEKMSADNLGLLINYARAWRQTHDEQFRAVAEGIIRFATQTLFDHEAGGFYGSQDADISLHDDGDYFTWTLTEVQAVLSGAELDAAVHWFDIRAIGDMRESPDRNVLHVTKSLDSLARLMRLPGDMLAGQIAAARAKLLVARSTRPTPWVDKTLFADLNGGWIRAMVEAHKLLDDTGALMLATRAANRVLRQCVGRDGRVRHYVLPPPPLAAGATDCELFGQLSDQAHLAYGLLGLYQVTGQGDWLEAARRLLDWAAGNLFDTEAGGFMDSPAPADATDSPARLSQPHKPWEDAPMQSANSVMCLALLEAWQLTGQEDYRDLARRSLAGFAGAIAPQIGLYVAGWALAADMLLHPPPHVTVTGRAEQAGPLLRVAWQDGSDFRTLTQPGDGSLGQATAQVCVGTSCQAAVGTAHELSDLLNRR